MLAGSAAIDCGELSVEIFRDVEFRWYFGGEKLGLVALVLPKNRNEGGAVLLRWSGESVALIVVVIMGCGPAFSRFVVLGRGNFGPLLCCSR